jgi:hypothetical protein
MVKGKRIICLMAALAFLALGTGAGENRSLFRNPVSLPLEISEFYEDYNFIASFSTPSERDVLIDCFSKEVLPEDIRTDRMNRVFRLMKKLYSQIMRIDPKMVQRVGPRKPYIKYFFKAELLDIKKIDRSGKKAVVEILAYAVEPEFVNRYIRQLEADHDDEEKVPSDEERIESVKNRVLPKTEFHIWMHQNGRWMKAEHKNVYIKN